MRLATPFRLKPPLLAVPLAPLLVAGWCLLLLAYGLAAGPLYRTESLRAIIGRSCLEGHWLYPVLYGSPFLTKPPGHYVAIGLCSLPFGEVTAATARIPSVLAALVAIVMMFGLFRRVLGERAGLLVALLMPCSVLWLDKVPSAEIDMTLVGWVTAALVWFYFALETDGRKASVGFWVLSLTCVAGGTLTKWTAPAFFYLTAIPLLAWRGRLGLLFGWRHLLAVGVAGALCAAWAAAVVNHVGWDALADTLRKEAAYRFAPKTSKGYPWAELATYPLSVFAAHLPMSAFALLTVRRRFWDGLNEREKRLAQFLHCWTWPNLLFWTLVPNHNVRYALPLSAGLMGLGVMGLLTWLRPAPTKTEENSPREGGGCRGPTPPGPPSLQGGGESDEVAVCAPSSRSGSEGSVSPPPAGRGGGGVGPRDASGITSAGALGRPVLAFLLCWVIVKVVFVEVIVPNRTAGRNADATGAQLREHVSGPLYVFKLKDEGVTFYYAREVRRATDPQTLPPGAFALLIRQEWEDRATFGHLTLVCCMHDQQGDPIYLVERPREQRFAATGREGSSQTP